MSLVLDAVYAVVAGATAPWWMRKARADWGARFGRIDALPAPIGGRSRLLLHAVSVGEVNLLRPLVRLLENDVDLVVSVTTDTGIARARDLYADRCRVVRFPLDASWSVRRFLDVVRPDAVALTELEIWPNFMEECRRRSIGVAVINGRLSARSFRSYRLLRWSLRRYFGQLEFAAVQDDAYARRFRFMGVRPLRCHVAGTMKWDAADVTDDVHGASALAEALGIDRSRPLIVAGSTAPDEHDLLHRGTPEGVQLLCAPRRPEWFDGAASALPGCVRRSVPGSGNPSSGRFLLDSIGELRMAYSLADIAVVGRSFGDLHGSDPMEPAALAKPVVIGPAVSDFQTTVDAMKRDRAIVQVTRAELARVLWGLLADPARRSELAAAARRCVVEHQGASVRHAGLLRSMLERAGCGVPAERAARSTPGSLARAV